MTRTAGCQMCSPCKQKLIWQPNISRSLDRERVGVETVGTEWGIDRLARQLVLKKHVGIKVRALKISEIERKKNAWGVKLNYAQLTVVKPGIWLTPNEKKMIWIHPLGSALISAGAGKAKCLYYFISQLAARRLLSLCAYWPTVCGCSFIVWGVLYKRSIRGEWLDYGAINALC